MPRKHRFYLPGVPAHIVQRGNCRQATFFADEDYLAYLGWLWEGARLLGCAIHAYALMTNHVHILVTPQTADSIGSEKGAEGIKNDRMDWDLIWGI